jgi:hypothetical protein
MGGFVMLKPSNRQDASLLPMLVCFFLDFLTAFFDVFTCAMHGVAANQRGNQAGEKCGQYS